MVICVTSPDMAVGVLGRSPRHILLDDMGNFIGDDLTPRWAGGAPDRLFLQIWMKNG
jgi:hypothetical protein